MAVTRTGGRRPASARVACAALALLAAGCARGAHGPVTHRVTIHGLRFDPETLQVATGDSIEWQNDDIVPHTASEARRAWDTDTLPPQGHARILAPPPASYAYVCRVHPSMRGVLVVSSKP